MSEVKYLDAPHSVHMAEQRLKNQAEITTLTPFTIIQADDLSLNQMMYQAVDEAYAGKRDPDEVTKLVKMTQMAIKCRRDTLNLNYGAARDAITTELMEVFNVDGDGDTYFRN
jgi:hypothetical protein